MNDKKVKDKRTKILEGFFPSSFDHIYKYDRDGRYTYASVGGARALGLKPTEMVGKTWEELGLPPEFMEPFDDKLEAVFDSGQPLTGENTFKTIEGEKDFEYILSPILGNNGNVEKVECRVKDITDHKRAEQVVIESRLFANGIVETMHEPIVVLDSDLKVITANRSFYETFKITPKETEGQLLYELGTRQLNVPKLRKVLNTVILKNTKIENFKVENEFPEIGKRTILLNARRINSDTAESQMILLAIEDITEHKNAEEELRKHRKHLEELVEARTAELNKINDLLEQEITERKLGEKRIEHLNTVLRAIRNVNQLITKEKDPDKLIASSCKQLIENRGYFNSWISIFNENGHYKTAASAGMGKNFSPIKKIMKAGKMLKCQKIALKKDGVVLIENPIKTCKGCPHSSKHQGTGILVTRLEHEGRTYGTLTVSFPEALATDREEQMLFKEVADDISFALHSIGIEEERKRAEEILRKNEEFLSDITSNVPGLIFQYELDTKGKERFTFISDGIRELMEVEPDAVMADTKVIWDTYLEEYIPDLVEKIKESVEKLIPWHTEYQVRTGKSGTLKWVEGLGIPKRMVNGNMIWNGWVRDITDRKRVEVALCESEEKMRAILDSMPDVVLQLDPDLEIVWANETTLKLNPHAIGQLCYKALPGRKVVCPGCPIVKALKTGQTERGIVHLQSVAGVGESYWDDVGIPIKDAQGKITGIVKLARNVTDRKRAEVEHEQLNTKLALKNKELEQIVYVTSHDLRSPLVNVLGFSKELENSINELTSILRSEGVPESVKENAASLLAEDIPESMQYIQTSILKMDSLLDGLLTISRVGRAEAKKEQIDMNELMTNIFSTFEYRIKDTSVNLKISKLPGCIGDPNRVNQSFSNLLDNALKYLDPARAGKIKVSGRKKKDRAVYCIEDNGIGIASEHHDKIFEMFHQLDPVKGNGEGLGLTIVRKILERHDGTIWVESEPDKGSKFYISLPGV